MKRRDDQRFTDHAAVALWYDQKFTEMGGSWHVPDEELNEMLDLLGCESYLAPEILHRPTLLDLGCGDGKLMLQAHIRGLDVIGIDISPVARDMAAARMRVHAADSDEICERNHAAWDVLGYPMEDMADEGTGIPDSTFDFVISYGSIEHAISIPDAIREFTRVLKHGGRYLLYAPNEDWHHDDQPLETTATANEWMALLEDAGLQIATITRRGDNNIIVGRRP